MASALRVCTPGIFIDPLLNCHLVELSPGTRERVECFRRSLKSDSAVSSNICDQGFTMMLRPLHLASGGQCGGSVLLGSICQNATPLPSSRVPSTFESGSARPPFAMWEGLSRRRKDPPTVRAQMPRRRCCCVTTTQRQTTSAFGHQC